MTSSRFFRGWVAALTLALTTGLLVSALPAAADDFTGSSRAAWLLGRIDYAAPAATSGQYFQHDQFGTFSGDENDDSVSSPNRKHSPWLMLASAVVPGSGELLMGHWIRGSALVAADAYSWYQVKEAGDEGREIEDEFYAFADDHWTEDNLFQAYDPDSFDIQRGGVGLIYFDLTDDDGNPVASMSSVDELRFLSLWVSKQDDEREYYENLGKWDQFVFGWDDFLNPEAPPAGIEYTPDLTLSDLRQPWTSVRRETYRDLREASNDAFKRQDRYRYVNIGLRLFSVLEVAYLQGWLGGEDEKFEVSGHEVSVRAEAAVRGQSTLAAQISF